MNSRAIKKKNHTKGGGKLNKGIKQTSRIVTKRLSIGSPQKRIEPNKSPNNIQRPLKYLSPPHTPQNSSHPNLPQQPSLPTKRRVEKELLDHLSAAPMYSQAQAKLLEKTRSKQHELNHNSRGNDQGYKECNIVAQSKLATFLKPDPRCQTFREEGAT